MRFPLDDLTAVFVQARTRLAMQYLEQTRGLSRQLLDRLGVGVTPVSDVALRPAGMRSVLKAIDWLGDDGSIARQWQGRIVFPARDEQGHTTNFHLRVIPGTRSPGRWSSLSRREELPFYPWQIDPTAPWWPVPCGPEVVITEGLFDACRVVQAGLPSPVATLGTAHPILPLLIQLAKRSPPVKRATLMLDFDEPGRRATMHVITQIHAAHATFPFELRVVSGIGIDAEDPGAATDDDLCRIFASATPAKQWLRDIMEASLDMTDAWQRHALEVFLRRHSP